MHDFSPYQLNIGKYPKLPSAINNKSPALTCQRTSKILSNNFIESIYKAREAFIHCQWKFGGKSGVSYHTTLDVWVTFSTLLAIQHCTKCVQMRVFPGPYFPAFGLNTEIYSKYGV